MSDLPPTPPEQRGLSGGARWALALVAVAAAVVAFVVLRGGDDESSGRGATATAMTNTATQTVTPTQTAPATTTPTASTPTATATTPEPPPVATVRVVGGQPQGGVQTFVFHKGDTIRLRVISDTADEVHVHGYDLKRDVAAGGEVELEFEASIEGRFEVELESAATQLALLEVQP